MSRILPSPVISFVILVFWLLVNGISVAHGLLGVFLAISIPLVSRRVNPERPTIRSPIRIARLALIVLYDIVKANIEVALRILGPQSKIQSDYIWIPLDIHSPYGIASLAGIITMTPGTLSADVSEDRQWLLVHCFHVVDKQAAIADIKGRYERALMEIFR